MRLVGFFGLLLAAGVAQGSTFAKLDSPDDAYHYNIRSSFADYKELEAFASGILVPECSGRPYTYAYRMIPPKKEKVVEIPSRPLGGWLFRLFDTGEIECTLKRGNSGTRNATFEDCLVRKFKEECVRVGEPVHGLEYFVYTLVGLGTLLGARIYTYFYKYMIPYRVRAFDRLFRSS